MTARAAAGCWLTAGTAYVVLEAITAAAYPGYRYDVNFISDLGAARSPLSPLMNVAFVVQGTLFVAAAVALTRATPARTGSVFVGCAAANAVGNVGVAIVASGSGEFAWVHVVAAVVAILGGNAAVVAGFWRVDESHWYATASVAFAVLGLVAFVLLAVASVTRTTIVVPTAVWERTSVYTIIGWQLLSAMLVLRRRR